MESRNILRAVIVGIAAIAFASTGFAQSKNTEHTYRLDADAERPSATLADVAWLVGNWHGDAFGGTFEEVWNPASAGSMVGFFKLLGDDAVAFYELMLLIEDEGSLSLKVKHFNADFSAWETKEEHVTFRLVKIEPDAVHFSGLSFYRVGPDEIVGYLVLTQNGERREEKLVYQRR